MGSTKSYKLQIGGEEQDFEKLEFNLAFFFHSLHNCPVKAAELCSEFFKKKLVWELTDRWNLSKYSFSHFRNIVYINILLEFYLILYLVFYIMVPLNQNYVVISKNVKVTWEYIFTD